MEQKEHYVYIMSNTTGSVLYVGLTNDIEKKVLEHREHQISDFVDKFSITRLVRIERFQNLEDAMDREKEIKGWRRSRKINLIMEDNPHWEELKPRE